MTPLKLAAQNAHDALRKAIDTQNALVAFVGQRKRFGITMKDGKTRLVRGWVFSAAFGCCKTPDGFSLTHLPSGRTLGFFRNRKAARDVADYVEKHSDGGLSSWKVKTVLKAIPREVKARVRQFRLCNKRRSPR